MKPLIGDVEDGEFWETVRSGAGGLFIYAEDDGWPQRMLVQRISGLCVRLVLVATHGHRPYLEESIYPFRSVSKWVVFEYWGSGGPLAQEAARPPRPLSSQLAARRDAAWFS